MAEPQNYASGCEKARLQSNLKRRTRSLITRELAVDNPNGLRDLLASRQIELTDDQVEALETYHRVLLEWNQQINLTRHSDPATFVDRDVWDSYQLAQHLGQGANILDVGTGGGVPGVILAILRPDLTVGLAESVGKKAQVVADIVQQVGVDVTVYAGRAEEVVEHVTFETLVARAVGPLWKILGWFEPHWDKFGRLLLIKGPKWVDERGEARHRGKLQDLHLRRLGSYTTPGHDGESVILAIAPSEDRLHDVADSDG